MSVPITRDGPYAAPYSYRLAAGESWTALTISAVFDGTAASGAFYPCCSLYTQDGKLVSRDFPSTSVAAGASAEVTYHPFLRTSTSAAPPSGGGAPSVATFYRSAAAGDPAQSIAGGGGSHTLAWPHAALPSDGSITGPSAFNFVTFNIDCMAIMWLRVAWEDGAYEKTAVIGTTSRIVQADVVAPSNYWPGASPLNTDLKDWVVDGIPNAFQAGNLSFAYAINGDGVAHDVTDAYLVYYIWPATGYNGSIPGWPQ